MLSKDKKIRMISNIRDFNSTILIPRQTHVVIIFIFLITFLYNFP